MQVSDLRGILEYIPRFRDRTFVIAIDGEIIDSENFSNLLLDLAVLRSLNVKVVIVHGASHQIEARAAALGMPITNADGSGITDENTLKISLDAATRLTHEIMEGLTSVDLRAIYANTIIAYPAGILGGVDQLYTGKVERVDTQSLQLFLDQGIVPVLPPLGFDGDGKTYRVNSDTIAVEVAEALRASKIIFLCEAGSLRVDGQLVQQLSVEEAEELVKKGKLAGDQKALSLKLEAAARACRQGIPRVHLLDGHVNEALLAELFSSEGIGTMVHSNEYQHIRRAFKKDVRRIMTLIRQSVQNAELIHRTRADIVSRIEDYWVLEIDRNLVGCIALHPFPKEGMAELACLYVKRNHENAGYGRKLMTFIEETARKEGFKELFALSTQAFVYLQQKGGFQEALPDVLPASRREKYEQSGRHSKVLIKHLTPYAGSKSML
jgi:amino-acid N-acetyltransferase